MLGVDADKGNEILHYRLHIATGMENHDLAPAVAKVRSFPLPGQNISAKMLWGDDRGRLESHVIPVEGPNDSLTIDTLQVCPNN
jgi:hypothetical protein